jgi:hypothetical protein
MGAVVVTELFNRATGSDCRRGGVRIETRGVFSGTCDVTTPAAKGPKLTIPLQCKSLHVFDRRCLVLGHSASKSLKTQIPQL